MAKLPGALALLNDQQFDHIVAWLALGKTDVDIAKGIHESGWLLESKLPTLTKAVNRWRRSTGQNAVVLAVAEKMTTPAGKLKRHLDVVDELTDMAILQRERLQKMLNQEANIPLLLGAAGDEMMRLTAILDKLGKFQLETGLMRKVRVGQVAADYDPPAAAADAYDGIFSPEQEAAFATVDAEFLVMP